MPFLERSKAPRLYYELDDFTDPWKRAPCVLLQHGGARSSVFWRAWVPYLSRFYRVIRPDLRGMGQSTKDFNVEDGISTSSCMQDINDLLDHLAIESVHYCGESSAGIIGMALAAEYPCRVRTLTLVSSPVYMTEEDKKSSLGDHVTRVEALRAMGARGWLEASNAGRRFPSDTDPTMLAWSLDEMAKTDVEVLVAGFLWSSQADAKPYLPKITAPVLGLYPTGGEGIITRDEQIDYLRANLKNVRIVRMSSRAHSLQVVMPAACALEMLYFISQHDGITCRE